MHKASAAAAQLGQALTDRGATDTLILATGRGQPGDAAPDATRVLFTAHSLPERIIAAGDIYPDELRSTADLLAGIGLVEADVDRSNDTGGELSASAGRLAQFFPGQRFLVLHDTLLLVGLAEGAAGFIG